MPSGVAALSGTFVPPKPMVQKIFLTCTKGTMFILNTRSAHDFNAVNGTNAIPYTFIVSATGLSAFNLPDMQYEGTGTGAPISILLGALFETIPASLPPGVYSDTVTIDLNF